MKIVCITIAHGCVYCYANYNKKTVVQNRKLHDPKSPFLIGNSMEGDIVKEARQVSLIERQIKFF